MASCIIILIILVMAAASGAGQQSSSSILSGWPNLSTFASLLDSTEVAKEIDGRSSLTILVPENAVLDPILQSFGGNPPLLLLADILRYHCLLQYLDIQDMRAMADATGMLVTTLYQTTGRASGMLGFVNVSVETDGSVHFGLPVAGSPFNASVVKNITQFPYNISFLQIDHVLMPLDLETPAEAAPAVDNMLIFLEKEGNFKNLIELLHSTGVIAFFKSMHHLTFFAPVDEAFGAVSVDGLSQSQKTELLQYHAVGGYNSLAGLHSGGLFPTLSTQDEAILNVSSEGSKINVLVGNSFATIVGTILDQPPVVVYSIDGLLIGQELSSAISEVFAPSLPPEFSPSLAPSFSSARSPEASMSQSQDRNIFSPSSLFSPADSNDTKMASTAKKTVINSKKLMGLIALISAIIFSIAST